MMGHLRQPLPIPMGRFHEPAGSRLPSLLDLIGSPGARMPNSSIRILLFIAAASLSTSATAEAQGTADQQAACIDDAFRFCRADIPNAARVEACLESNKSKLKPACQAQFDQPVKKKPRFRARRVEP
jgi:hypothetical protein